MDMCVKNVTKHTKQHLTYRDISVLTVSNVTTSSVHTRITDIIHVSIRVIATKYCQNALQLTVGTLKRRNMKEMITGKVLQNVLKYKQAFM